MTRLTREQLLAAATKLPTVTVTCEELGGDVELTMLTANAKIDWVSKAYPDGKVDMREYEFGLVAASILDDTGAPMFTSEEIGTFSETLVVKLHAAAATLNSIGAQAVAASEGKSDAGRDSSGASGSPGDSDTPTLT